MSQSIYRRLRAFWYLVASVFLIATVSACGDARTHEPESNPFEAYLAEADPVYDHELLHTTEGEGYTSHVLRMVSQRWLSEDLVDETTWWHYLTIIVPDEIEHTTGLLWIGGGTRDDDPPEDSPRFLINAALATNSVVAHLHNVPFQPVQFESDEAGPRYEDDLIAYGWRQFLEGGARDEDAEWLARLPMTKAAIRAMDTITEYTSDHLARSVDDYVVAGASKRGWTTWTTGIFDDRVIAIAPAVIDLLNLQPSFEHHWRAYGEWSPAISEYEDERIMDWQFSQEFERMVELVDPYSYRDRLDLPKFIVNASGDEFFLPDSWQFYWEDLPGEKYLRYVPNTGHSLDDTDASQSLIAFYAQAVTDTSMPPFEWSVEDETIRIETDPESPPEELKLWQATNTESRDFRLYVIERTWTSKTLPPSDDGRYEVSVDTPEEGYTAFFVEASFSESNAAPLKLSTGVVITPDTYPHPPYESEDPKGARTDQVSLDLKTGE